jgi:hypothetical protein
MSAAAVRRRVKAASETNPDGLCELYLQRAASYLVQAVAKPGWSIDDFMYGIALGFYHAAHLAADARRGWPTFQEWSEALGAALDGGDGSRTDWTVGGHA